LGNKRNGIQHTAEEDIQNAPYPLICTPKIDGIRAFVLDHQATSRNGKEIPNYYIAEKIGMLEDGLDGEIVTYTNGIMDDFNTVQSKVMSKSGKPEFKYMIFDFVGDNDRVSYAQRLANLAAIFNNNELENFCEFVEIEQCNNPEELEAYETKCLLQGYEGICMRKPNSPYKGGRSTWNEFYLAALTRWTRRECQIIDFEEMEENTNQATEGAFGLTERSGHKEGMVGKDMLGAFIVECMETGQRFKVGGGVGVDINFRQEVWNNKINYIGKIFTYKFKQFGMKDLPRHPQFVGWRSANDM
jgi:DNA ligase-1